ncbi:hypothetical protein NC652_031093, partial [Populus alba x Populus x berolinensis]
VTEKPKTHDCDAKNPSHTTTKLPSLSLDSYLASCASDFLGNSYRMFSNFHSPSTDLCS